jgi:hypothetical protein
MSLPGDENPNPQWKRREDEPKPQWTSGNPLGEQADEQPAWQQQPPASEWQHQPPSSEWQRQPQPHWQAPPNSQYAGWVPPPRTPGQAYAALILGIVGLFPVCPVILSVIAVILGFIAKNQIDRSGGQLGGSGIAVAGIITGFVGAALYVLFFVAVFAIGAG